MRWFCHINRFLMLFISQPSSAVQNKFSLTAETMPHAFCKCKLPVLGGNPTPPHLDPHTRDRKNTLHCSNQIETDRDGARGRHQAATEACAEWQPWQRGRGQLGRELSAQGDWPYHPPAPSPSSLVAIVWQPPPVLLLGRGPSQSVFK